MQTSYKTAATGIAVLPDAMPTAFVPKATLPSAPNGKVALQPLLTPSRPTPQRIRSASDEGLITGAAPTGEAIHVEGLVKTYANGVRAVDGLSFTVRHGRIFALLGPNGAGKSTTMKMLTTLTRPDSGTARVAGYDVLTQPDQVRRAIGVVAQRSGCDPEASGRANLMLQGRLYGMRGKALKRRVETLLERFDLARFAGRPAGSYSGGMQRRLDVALGLVHTPMVLFLDEPTTGLDPEARTAMWQEIDRLAAEEQLAILLTTHHLEEADRLAERLAIVDQGRIVVTGTPDELKNELRGDVLRIEPGFMPGGHGPQLARNALEGVPGMREISVDGRLVVARADHGAAAVPPALAALDRAGVQVASVTVARPSLDDVYLRYAGRSFAHADVAAAA